MIRLILAIICLLVFIGFIGYGITTKIEEEKEAIRVIKWIPLGLFIFFFAISFVRVINPGEVGIPVTLGNTGSQVGAGIQFVNPLATMHKLSVRTETYTMSISPDEGTKKGDDSVSVLGADGAQGSVDATITYHLVSSEASRVYKTIGTNFVEKIVRPTARTCIRNGFADFQMVEAATTKRTAVAKEIEDCIIGRYEGRGVELENFQLRDVHLSEEVQKSIDLKVQAQQASEQQRFELAKSQQRAEIARVEARGRADAQQIIACGGHEVVEGDTTKVVPNEGEACTNTLTPAYLQYLYIQTLQATVDSPNHSTVILPFDEKLTPLLNIPQGE